MSQVFSPIPIDELRKLNESKAKNVPEECPQDSPTDLNIKCGPILKLFNCNDKGSKRYLASLLIVLEDYPELPSFTYELGDLTTQRVVESGHFNGTLFHEQDNCQFFRFYIDLPLLEHETVCHYYVNKQTVGTWKFYLPSATQAMNSISFSCNGFSLGCDADEYPSSLWYDVLNRHAKNPYHVMLGGGDQIYCDSVKVMSAKFKEWTAIDSNHTKQSYKADKEFTDDLENYYLNHYFSWFGKGFWIGALSRYLDPIFPAAMNTIPSVNIYDDHDIIDGFGSYPDETMGNSVFKSLGNIAFKHYMIFQHHQLPGEKLDPAFEASWVYGPNNKNFIDNNSRSIVTKLGTEIGLVGFDCRTERSLSRIVKHDSYVNIFSRMQTQITDNPDIKHLFVMLGVPILYPRLVWLEMVLTSPLLKPIKKLAEHGIINKGLLNEFDGSVEVLDDLNDHWCSKNHKAERNKLVKDLMDFGAKNSVRVTILSGDVHLCCIGRLKSRVYHHPTFHPIRKEDIKKTNKNTLEAPETDPRLIFNVTSSAIINAPPPDAMAGLLNKRSKVHHFTKNCDEDVVPLFNVAANGQPRSNLQFLNKRNWADLILAKNSQYKDQIGETPIKKMPGSIKVENKASADERNISYPLFADSLVTTLHVEDDPRDFDCNTMGYELLIPPLQGSYKLDQVAIKHVNDTESS